MLKTFLSSGKMQNLPRQVLCLPTKKLKVQITYFPQSQPQPIFQSVESPTKENPNRRIFWTYYLVILSIFVLVIDDLDELGHGLKVHVWSMFSRPMHGPGSQVCLTFCFPLFCKLVHLPFSLELSGDMLYLLSIWPPSPNCALEIYWIRHHLPCKNGKMWVLQQFNFTLSLLTLRYVCISYAKPIGAF